MNEIEFLPKRFREKRRSSSVKIPRLLVFSLLVALLAVVSLYELFKLHHVRSQLATLKAQHERIAQLQQEVERTRNEVIQKRHHARLLTFLDHRYPKSQILAQITNPLPSEITIKRIELTHTQPVSSSSRQRSEKSSDQTPQGSPLEIDLKQLIADNKGRICTVELEGTTEDTSLLYTFLAALHESPLVDAAKIESIDPQMDVDGREFSNFMAHINIKRGHFDDFSPTVVQALETVEKRGGVR